MYYWLCLFLNFSILLFAFKSWIYLSRKKKNIKVFIDIFYLIIIFRIVSSGIIVDILRILSSGKINEKFAVLPYEIFEVTLFEFISNIIYLGTFLFLCMKVNFKRNYSKFHKNELAILCFFSVGSVFCLIFQGFTEKYLWLFKNSLIVFGSVSSVILLINSFLRNDKLKYLALINIILIFIINLIAGLRGAIFGLTIIALIYAYIQLPKKSFRKIIYMSFFPLLISLIASTYLGQVKYFYAVNSSSLNFKLENFKDYYNYASELFSSGLINNNNNSDFKITKIFDEIEYRFGASSLFGVGLIRLYDKSYSAGLKTEKNSFYSFLPRQIVGENKPVSGSVDGTKQTMGIYASYYEIAGVRGVMTDFYVSSHYYWQFGIIGVLVFSFLASIYSFLFLNFILRLNLLGYVFWIVSFKPYYFLPKLWFSEIIIMLSTIILPTIFLLYLFRILQNIKIKKSNNS